MSLEFRKTFFGTEKENIALLGSAPSSLRLAPFANPEWVTCGCSPGVYGCLVPQGIQTDVWVELHRVEIGQPWMSVEYFEFIKQHKGKVWMAEDRPDVPGCVTLPMPELIKAYSPYFFTSSIAYMMAMAIHAGFKKIGLYGIDMAAATEYKDQRLGCQYFALLAQARGIEVGVPPESDLFRPAPLYGISETSHARIKMMARRRELEGRVAAALQKQQEAKDESLYLRGALEDLEWNEMDWVGNIDGPSSRFLSPPPATALQQFNIDLHMLPEVENACEDGRDSGSNS